MKAAIIKEYGTPVEIKEVPKPNLLDDSVTIKVHSASINPIDNIIKAFIDLGIGKINNSFQFLNDKYHTNSL